MAKHLAKTKKDKLYCRGIPVLDGLWKVGTAKMAENETLALRKEAECQRRVRERMHTAARNCATEEANLVVAAIEELVKEDTDNEPMQDWESEAKEISTYLDERDYK